MSESAPITPAESPWTVPASLHAPVARWAWLRSGPGPMLRSMVLIAMVVVILVGAGVAGLVAYSMRKTAMDGVLPAQTRALEYMGRSLAFRVEQQQKPLLNLASVLADHMHEPRETIEALLLQPASMAHQFEQLQLADSRGQLLLSLEKDQQQPLDQLDDAFRAVLKKGLAEGKPVTHAWVRADEAGLQLEFHNVVPVRNAMGRLQGVLGASYKAPLSALIPLEEASSANADRQILLLDREARLLAQAENGQWQTQTSAGDSSLLRELDLAWFRSIQSGAVGERSGSRLWSAMTLPWNQWVLVKVSDEQEWLPGIFSRLMGGMALLIAAVALLLGLVLCLIAHPLTELFREVQSAVRRDVVTETDDSVLGANWWQRLSTHDWGEAQTLRTAMQALGRNREWHGERERQLQLQLQTLMDYAPVGLIVTQGTTVLRVGMQAARTLGYQPWEMPGLPVRALCAGDVECQALLDRVTRDLDIYGQFDSEVCLLRKDLKPVWVRIHGQSIQRISRAWGLTGKSAGEDYLVWELEDVTTKRLVREQSSWKAMHDTLTRLPNRAAFALRLKEWLQECTASSDSGHDHGVILYVDLDYFSQVNRKSGREVGDEVLGHMARLIDATVRPHGWVARVGGDEFAVLLPGQGREEGMRHAQRLCMAIQDWDGSHEGERYMLSASIGMLLLDASQHSVETVFKGADKACYAAKRKGRNRVEVIAAGE